jgi:hypothetical protein
VHDFAEVEGIFSRYLEEYERLRDAGVAADDPDLSALTCEVS